MTFQALQVVTPTDSGFSDDTVSMTDEAEAARWQEKYGKELADAYGAGGETLDDGSDILTEFGIPNEFR